MEPATAALIARAAIAAGTNKKVWTGIASVLAALCLPVILAVMCYISIASGGTEHNRAAVHLAFDGGEAPDGMPQLMNNSPMQSMCGMWQSMTQWPRQRGMNFPTGAAGTGQGISLCMICRPTGMEVISYSLHYQDWGIRTRRHSAEPGIMWTAVT